MAFRLVTDVSSEDDITPPKIRYAWYSTLQEAVAQAAHEIATPDAVEQHREHHGQPDLELHPSGVRVLRVEDEDGKTVWVP